jgi:hypothetical protein
LLAAALPADMSDCPDRLRRAVRSHDAFMPDGDRIGMTTTPFDAAVATRERADGRIAFAVTVRVPALNGVTEGDVADVVADGWYDTFRRRIEDVGGLTRGDHDLSPVVTRIRNEGDGRSAGGGSGDGAGDGSGDRGDPNGGRVVVEFEFDDIDPDRGLDDAAALINFVEGTYVQGVIPGYEYAEPVTGLLSRAQTAAGGDADAGIPPG